MPDRSYEGIEIRDWLEQSLLFRELQLERDEILKHKWNESQRAGYDIGFDRALADWLVKHRSAYRRSRKAQICCELQAKARE
jgi:hypothetical protein